MNNQHGQENTFEEDNQVIRDSLKALGEKYQVTKVSEAEEANIQERLSQFDMFSAFQQVVLYGAARITHNEKVSYLTVITLNAQPEGLTAYQGQQPDLTRFTFAGLTALDKNYGHVHIRPVTTTDKLIELFKPVKVKFEADKDFHKHYHVTADNPEHLKEQMTESFLAAIKQYDGLQIEIKDHDMLVRLPKGLSVDVAEQLGDFMVRVKEV
jgi:hypothetical protein